MRANNIALGSYKYSCAPREVAIYIQTQLEQQLLLWFCMTLWVNALLDKAAIVKLVPDKHVELTVEYARSTGS